jgi:hypothetical protein
VANEVKGTENVIIIAGEEKENNAIFLFLWTGRFAQATIVLCSSVFSSDGYSRKILEPDLTLKAVKNP